MSSVAQRSPMEVATTIQNAEVRQNAFAVKYFCVIFPICFDVLYESARIFREFDSFIGKPFRGEAVVYYREPLITSPLGESGS